MGSIDEVVSVVKEAFWGQDKAKLVDIWITFQMIMKEILKEKGGNEFRLPHAYKERERKEGNVISSVICDADTINSCLDLLKT